MKRWLPSPLLSASIAVLWIFLQHDITPVTIVTAVLLGVGMPLLTRPLRPTPGPLRHPLVLVRLILVVGMDVVRSAIDVASGVLRSRRRPPRGTFVVIPLDLRDTHGLAALCMITAVVPGTVWFELAPDHTRLRLHVFDVADVDEFIDHYKGRYELPLKEIFG